MNIRLRYLAYAILIAGLALVFVLPVLTQDSAGPPSGNGVVPVYAAGNPMCDDYGLLELAYFDTDKTTYNTTINGVTVSSADGTSFNWSSAMGIDLVIVKGGSNSNLYYYNEGTGDSSLHAPINPQNSQPYDLSHISFCVDVELDVTKTAQTSLTRTYTWDITKDFDAEYWKFIGDVWSHGYQVAVNRYETDSNWAVTGNIYVTNPYPFASAEVTVTDSVGGIPANVTCPSSTVPAGGMLTCTYSASLPDGSTRTNTATASTTTFGFVGDSGTATVDFSTATVNPVGYPAVNVTDTNGQAWPTGGDNSWSYSRNFDCPTTTSLYVGGVYSYQHVNTATITETGQSDIATVIVHCYLPSVSKDANTRYTRTYDWTIDKAVDDDSHSGFPGDQFTSNYDVTVNRTEQDSGFEVYGTITVNNPNPNAAMTVSVADAIGMNNAVLDCGGSLVVPAGGSNTCGYVVSVADKSSGTNTATVTLNSIQFPATWPFAFGDPTTYAGDPADITVNDTNIAGTPDWMTTTTSHLWEYPLDFTCPTDTNLYFGGVYSWDVDNTATIVETGEFDDESVTVTCYLWDVSKTAPGSYNDLYGWDINKTVTPPSQNGFAGDILNWTWSITWVQVYEMEINHLVDGVITVINPAPMELTVDVTDYLTGNFAATVTCNDADFGTSLTIAPNSSGTCNYTAAPGSQLAQNTATATRNGVSVSDTVDVDWVKGPNVIPPATISDSNNATIPADATQPYQYPESATCSGDLTLYGEDGMYPSGLIENTATVTWTGGSDSSTANTTYTCYIPSITKTAAGTYDERHEWDVTKTVSPLTQSAFAGDTVYFDWTITVTEDVFEENFDVSGQITVVNPNPEDALVVSLSDVVNGTTANITGCAGEGVTFVAGTLTVPASGTAVCDYEANDLGYTALVDAATVNTATIVLNGISFPATDGIEYTANVIRGTATLDDDQFPFDGAPVFNGWTETYTDSDGYTCSSDVNDYTDGADLDNQVSNTAEVYSGGALEDSSTATTEVDCYVPSISKTAAGTYDERHVWDVEKSVDLPSQSGYPGDVLGWTWTVNVTETVTESNFDVTGQITIVNPNPEDALSVSLSDVLSDSTVANITGCTGGVYGAGTLLITAGGTAVCDYQANDLAYADDALAPTSNTATIVLNDIPLSDDDPIEWTPNVIDGSAVLTDDEIGLNETLTAGEGPWEFTANDGHTCSSSYSDYGADGSYGETINNTATVTGSDGQTDSANADTTYLCEAGSVDLLKLTNGEPTMDQTWSFKIYLGPDGFGGTEVASDSTPPTLLDFGYPALRPNTSYTICELEVPAGYSSFWQIDTNGDGIGDTTVVPYNPNADDPQPEDLGNRCVDFGAGTNIPVVVGQTLHFVVNNEAPGGAPRTPGYWKNWNRCTGGGQQYTADANGGYLEGFWLLEDVLDPTIGGGIVWDDILADDTIVTINSCAVAVDILDKRQVGEEEVVGDGRKVASDPLHNLATHLLAAQLNFGAGACTTQDVLDAALAAETLLDKYNFNGFGHDQLGKKSDDVTLANNLASYLDQYNNGMFCGDGHD